MTNNNVVLETVKWICAEVSQVGRIRLSADRGERARPFRIANCIHVPLKQPAKVFLTITNLLGSYQGSGTYTAVREYHTVINTSLVNSFAARDVAWAWDTGSLEATSWIRPHL